MGLDAVLTDNQYQSLCLSTADLAKSWTKSLNSNELTKFEEFKSPAVLPRGKSDDPAFMERMDAFMGKCSERDAMAKSLVQEMVWKRHPNLRKDGVTSSLGFNFYDLRGPAFLIYPVNVIFRNTIPRIGKVNAGYGTVANWKATRNPGVGYMGASEGNRVAYTTPDEINYNAYYKEIGTERQVTFTAEFAGEGYTDNLADEHIRGLHSLWLGEEGMIINGNSGGTGGIGNGFKLGTPVTPTTALTATHTVGAAGSGSDLPYTTALTTSNYVSVAYVALTAMGNPNNNQYGYFGGNYPFYPTIATGLTPSYIRNNADGSRDTVSGGTSAVSAISVTPLQATSGNLTITATGTSIKGAFGYAWFVDVETTNTGTLANAKLAGITQYPFAYISGTPTGTQTATATGLNVDSSFNPLDFDGLLSYAASTAGAAWTDMLGTSLTSQKNGRVTQIETILLNIWQLYQTTVDEIWGDATAINALDQAIRYSGTSVTGFQFMYTRDSQNNLLGGFVVSAYQSRYAMASPTGATAIPIRIHPMVPAGTLYFRVKTNPYQQSRLPYTEGMLVQRDYYSIEWPQVNRTWQFGTYCHEVLAMTTPWIPAVLTGIGAFVGS